MKVWVVRGGDVDDYHSHVIGVCATKELAEELKAREDAWPNRWATIREEDLLTELPDWEPPVKRIVYNAYFSPHYRHIVVLGHTEVGEESDFYACENEAPDSDAYGTDKEAVIAYVRKWCEDRHFRNVKVVEE